MRVAYVCLDPGIPISGHKGASNHVREFVHALARSGYDVDLFAARTGEPGMAWPCRIEAIPAPAADSGLPPSLATEVTCLHRNESLRDALEQAHRRKPFDFLYERYSLWSYAALEFARAHGLPLALEVNSPLRLEQRKYRALHLEPAARAIELLMFAGATLVVGVSQAVVDYVTGASGRTAPAMVLPNGVDLDLFRGITSAAPDAGAFTVGFVGSLKPWHGVEVLLEAFRMLSAEDQDYRLLVVGDGPLRASIEQFAQESGLGARIELTGAIDKPAVAERLARMHVAVAPYPHQEDFYFSPLKLFEYMAAGRAIAASRIGQVSEVLQDGVTGLLVEPGSAAELAAAIRRLRREPSLLSRLGQNARDEAFMRHGWEQRVGTVVSALSLEAQGVPA